MEVNKSTLIKIIFIIIFFISTFTAEFFYRDPLFNNSVKIAEKLQDKLSSLINFFDFYTYLGKIDYILITLVLLFFPVSYCYAFCLTVILTWHLAAYLKMIYGNGRPAFTDINIQKFKFSGANGYGNPSGHSYRSCSNYLALAQIIIDIWELKVLPRILIYIGVAILILIVNLSRVVLGAHSINQVIFGDTLGFTEYFIIFQIIKPHLRKSQIFFERFLKIKYHIYNWIFLLIIILYSTLASIICEKERNNSKEKDYIAKAMNSALAFTSYYGMIYGLTALAYITKSNYYGNYNSVNYYYRNSKTKWYINYPIKLILVLICFFPYIANFIKFKNIDQIYIYIFGNALPMFIYGFLYFGPYFIINIILKISNKDIYNINKEPLLNNLDYNLGLDEEDIIL